MSIQEFILSKYVVCLHIEKIRFARNCITERIVSINNTLKNKAFLVSFGHTLNS